MELTSPAATDRQQYKPATSGKAGVHDGVMGLSGSTCKKMSLCYYQYIKKYLIIFSSRTRKLVGGREGITYKNRMPGDQSWVGHGQSRSTLESPAQVRKGHKPDMAAFRKDPSRKIPKMEEPIPALLPLV